MKAIWNRALRMGLLAALGLVVLGCRPERYFGPYRIELPTELHERSAGRSFLLPLDAGDLREQADLDWCLAHEPDRELPCRCDYPVLTVDEQDLRLDYRLENTAGDPVNASVWLGLEVPAGEAAPGLLPDLPRVAVLATHLHRLEPGVARDDSFSEDELHQADLAFAAGRYPECDLEPHELPAPLQWLVGASLAENVESSLTFEFTIRIRPGS